MPDGSRNKGRKHSMTSREWLSRRVQNRRNFVYGGVSKVND